MIVTGSRRQCCDWSLSSGRRSKHDLPGPVDERKAAPRAGGPEQRHHRRRDVGVRSQERTSGGAAEDQREHAQRNWQMTGAEHECPYHPRHSPVFELPRSRDLAGLHRYAPFARITTKPTTNAVTTPMQARIIIVVS
jgi:hypothetical protein